MATSEPSNEKNALKAVSRSTLQIYTSIRAREGRGASAGRRGDCRSCGRRARGRWTGVGSGGRGGGGTARREDDGRWDWSRGNSLGNVWKVPCCFITQGVTRIFKNKGAVIYMKYWQTVIFSESIMHRYIYT